MDKYEVLAIVAVVLVVVVVMLLLLSSRIVANTTKRSARAKQLHDMAQQQGLQYVAEEGTLSQRLMQSDRRTNMVTGELGNVQIVFYDFDTRVKNPDVLGLPLGPLWALTSPSKSYVHVVRMGEDYYKPDLPLNDVRQYLTTGQTPSTSRQFKLSAKLYRTYFGESSMNTEIETQATQST